MNGGHGTRITATTRATSATRKRTSRSRPREDIAAQSTGRYPSGSHPDVPAGGRPAAARVCADERALGRPGRLLPGPRPPWRVVSDGHDIAWGRPCDLPAGGRGAADDRQPVLRERRRAGGLRLPLPAAAGDGHPGPRLAAAVVHADRPGDDRADRRRLPRVGAGRPAARRPPRRRVGSAADQRQCPGIRGGAAGDRAAHARSRGHRPGGGDDAEDPSSPGDRLVRRSPGVAPARDLRGRDGGAHARSSCPGSPT